MRLMPWQTARLVITHAVASVVVLAGMTVAGTLAFIALLVWTLAAGSGGASPLTAPAAVLATLAAGVASVPLALLPATILADAITARTGLRMWWQIPIAAGAVFTGASIVALLADATGITSALSANPAPTSVRALMPLSVGAAAAVTAVLLAPLSVYWGALQSTDWLLHTGARWLGVIWPSRFGALARPAEPPARTWRGAARFRVKEHFTYAEGLSTMVVLSGEIVDGSVRHGMRACAAAGSRTLTATIHSVEPADASGSGAPFVGLLLSVNESDLGTWKATAHAGTIIAIVE
jgi:hypothetical protein